MNIGDLVVRKKYQRDIVFEIYRIEKDLAYLKGVEVRLVADSPLDDLEVVDYHYQPEKNQFL